MPEQVSASSSWPQGSSLSRVRLVGTRSRDALQRSNRCPVPSVPTCPEKPFEHAFTSRKVDAARRGLYISRGPGVDDTCQQTGPVELDKTEDWSPKRAAAARGRGSIAATARRTESHEDRNIFKILGIMAQLRCGRMLSTKCKVEFETGVVAPHKCCFTTSSLTIPSCVCGGGVNSNLNSEKSRTPLVSRILLSTNSTDSGSRASSPRQLRAE